MRNIRDLVILFIFVVFILPSLLGIISWTIKSVTNPNPEELEGAEKLAEFAIPWWIGVIEWLTNLPPTIMAISIIALLLFLRWIGEIK